MILPKQSKQQLFTLLLLFQFQNLILNGSVRCWFLPDDSHVQLGARDQGPDQTSAESLRYDTR